MQFPQRCSSTAHGMIGKRHTGRIARIVCVFALSCTLAGCGGYVADHWPHWAGGMPNDVPPRPGAPGYEEFITHGLPDQVPAAAAANTAATDAGAAKPAAGRPDQKSAAAAAGPVFQQVAAPPAASASEPGDDSNVVKGGLY